MIIFLIIQKKNNKIDELKIENDAEEIISLYKNNNNYDINNSEIIGIDESDINLKKSESNYWNNYTSNSESKKNL